MLLPSALGFSPHPPVSVYGTGTWQTIAAFLGTDSTRFVTSSSLHITLLDYTADLPTVLLLRLYRSFHSRLELCPCVPTVLLPCGTGISTCYPSTTSFDLALGPDLPSADEKESSIHCRWQKALLKNGNRRSGKMMWSLTKEKDIM